MNVNERAAALLAELAQDLKDSHTVNGDWRGDTDARSSYNQMLALSQGLKAGIHFITAAPVKPDDDGFWTHPAIPDHFDEDPAPFQRWLRLKDNFPGDEDQERSLWDDLCDQDADEFDAWVDRHMEEDQQEPSDA